MKFGKNEQHYLQIIQTVILRHAESEFTTNLFTSVQGYSWTFWEICLLVFSNRLKPSQQMSIEKEIHCIDDHGG